MSWCLVNRGGEFIFYSSHEEAVPSIGNVSAEHVTLSETEPKIVSEYDVILELISG